MMCIFMYLCLSCVDIVCDECVVCNVVILLIGIVCLEIVRY